MNQLRILIPALALALIMIGQTTFANEDGTQWRYGSTLFGELKYGPDFKKYDHVNADAPKGGRLNQAALGGFDSFNPFVVRGRAAAGLNYQGGLLYDSLFAQAVDQSSASYGLLAEAFRYGDDYSWAVYRLNPKAKWHDGKPITPEDVRWSMEILREINPLWSNYYANVERVEITGENEISFFFDQKDNRELPQIIGDLPVLPKHWWTGKNAAGETRDISKPTTEPPLGSGPYKIGDFNMGKSVTWQRVENYWGADVPTQNGRYNFDEIHYTYFLEQTAIWEAFKKGGIIDLRQENRAQRWARSYDFPAIKKGDVLKREFSKTGAQIYQGYYLNTRKDKLKDRRVRQALTLLFDFETMNKNLFFNAYTRTDSFYEGGELQSSGIPQGRELEILEKYRGKIPDEVFTREFVIPNFSQDGAFRKAQRTALKLFTDAGYTFKAGKMLDKNGKQFTLEFIGNSPTDERIANPYFENLRTLGIKPALRVLDTAQYKNRLDKFDYEITGVATRQSLSPGNEQREYWSAKAAKTDGTRNYSGISDPVVDELVERLISASDRQELLDLTRALDRVLKWQYYAIPQWHNPTERLAWWRKLQFVDKQPTRQGTDLFSFWIDTNIEKELEGSK
ncbi:MAG: extracellular solute-binding protein [Rhizobiaceae bacterium]|nr:extracellular solute-binding protein [Rhizobiaceae bacterium]